MGQGKNLGLRTPTGKMKRCILCFAHEDTVRFSGGLAKYIHEESALAAARGVAVATVFPLHVKQFPRLAKWASRGWGGRWNGHWLGMHDWRGLASMVGNWERHGWALSEIQLHHIGGYDAEDLQRFLAVVPVRVRLFLHDYHTICRSAHLMKDGKTHCGTTPPCEAKCRSCQYWNVNWLARMKKTLGSVGKRLKVTAPSESVARAWLESWPEFRKVVEVVPHWTTTRTVKGMGHTPGMRFRLAFAGGQSFHKGWNVWCQIVEELKKSGGNFDFLYFGLGHDIPRGVHAVAVREGEMVAALRRERVDFLCLWSVWPETFSYVYYEALQAGAWVLAPEMSGNIASAIRRGRWGTVFRGASELLAFLQNERRMRETLEGTGNLERPEEMSVNTQVMDTLPPAVPLGLTGGRARRLWAHEAVWKLKEWTGHAGQAGGTGHTASFV